MAMEQDIALAHRAFMAPMCWNSIAHAVHRRRQFRHSHRRATTLTMHCGARGTCDAAGFARAVGISSRPGSGFHLAPRAELSGKAGGVSILGRAGQRENLTSPS